jgi:hypothetical protein
MDYKEVKNSLKRMRLTIADLGKLEGIKPNSALGWSVRGVPKSAITILEVLEKLSIEEREKYLAEKLAN